MQYKNVFLTGILTAFLLAGCSNGDDGSDTPNQSQSCIDASGYWGIDLNVNPTNCGPEAPASEETSYKVLQSGCSITVYTTDGKFDGNVNGSNITWSGKYYNGPISTTFNANVNAAGTNFSGSSSWTISDGYGSCSGSTRIFGTIYNKQQ